MVTYETVRLDPTKSNEQTTVFSFKENCKTSVDGSIISVVNDFNERGYFLSAVAGNSYYMTKRVD